MKQRNHGQLSSREDLIEPDTTLLLFMALYSLVRAYFEAPRERAPDFD
jgi:hypothetical protein